MGPLQTSEASAVPRAILSTCQYSTVTTVTEEGAIGGSLFVVLELFVPGRLVCFDYNRQSYNWVIRDFIVGLRLESQHSPLLIPQIEADAVHDEFLPWCNVEKQPNDWKAYLRLRSTAYLG